MSPEQVKTLELLPAAARGHYRSACAAVGGKRVALLRDAQDAIDTGAAGQLCVWARVQAELTEAQQ